MNREEKIVLDKILVLLIRKIGEYKAEKIKEIEGFLKWEVIYELWHENLNGVLEAIEQWLKD